MGIWKKIKTAWKILTTDEQPTVYRDGARRVIIAPDGVSSEVQVKYDAAKKERAAVDTKINDDAIAGAKALLPDGRFKEYFKNQHVAHPIAIRCGEKAELEWLFGRDCDGGNIDGYRPGCGCTANVKWDNKKLTATYSDTTSKESFAAGEEEKIITKAINIYFKDGTPLHIEDGRGGSKYNPQKEKTTITFTVKVVK